jgi:site-specific DNA recombinase
MKKAIRYLRFSSDGQSASSIERQDMYTSQWCERNNVQILDTFTDAGYTARNFDRPDFEKLSEFIKANRNMIDFLVVDQMDRFSRDAGEAISLIKKLQVKYAIQIVSVTEGITFDYNTPGSFFRAGLQLLLAEEDNINRMVKINGGIYTAKAREGRYIHKAPFGYRKEGTGKHALLVPVEEEAAIIRFIFEAYLRGVSPKAIHQRALVMGLKYDSHSYVHKILRASVYAGLLEVKAFKEYPGGLFPGKHQPIIDSVTWQAAQDKITGKVTKKVTIDDAIPLRGVLKCHCGRMLTAAPSRGRHGGYWYYYKCNTASAHNSISANKAHAQLLEALGYMSLPERLVAAIKEKSEGLMDIRMKDNVKQLLVKRNELAKLEEQLLSVEEKWISNHLSLESYQRWYKDITQKRIHVKTIIHKLSTDQNEVFLLLRENLQELSDMQYVYNASSTMQKQELIRMVFDNRLYYKDKIYRTPYMMSIFTHNLLILKEKSLLELDGRGEMVVDFPGGGHPSLSIEPLASLLSFVKIIKTA